MPGLDEIAEVEPIDWGLVSASHMTFAQLLDIGRILAEHLARPEVAGAVVVQGTDAIEETAFAWDLLPLGPKPVVVVGAMRSASQDGYDGPENLRNAVLAAGSDALHDQGVVVALAGEIHGADDVRKTHTHAYATFQSPNLGRLGAVCRWPRQPRPATGPGAAPSDSGGRGPPDPARAGRARCAGRDSRCRPAGGRVRRGRWRQHAAGPPRAGAHAHR